MTSQSFTSTAMAAPRFRAQGLARVFATSSSAAPLILRAAVALVLFPHGAQKALGWFGGPGFTGTLEAFQQGFGIGPALAATSLFYVAGAVTILFLPETRGEELT